MQKHHQRCNTGILIVGPVLCIAIYPDIPKCVMLCYGYG